MFDVRRIAEEIVTREGGFVNDPDDPGGPTKHGVTIGTLRQLGIDVNKDGVINAADVRALTKAQALEIYLRHYYERPRISELPESIQASVFDMYVNSGSNAVKILQRVLTMMGFTCSVDGEIGPQTIRVATMAEKQAGSYLSDAYGIERRNFYYRLADARPASRKFARRRNGGKGGWIVRAEEFISPRYHLTDAQHAARTAAWT